MLEFLFIVFFEQWLDKAASTAVLLIAEALAVSSFTKAISVPVLNFYINQYLICIACVE
jgi:hypothetical protein|tara:strand:- start:430 stop:606 length:177 start_codon:yes stop_codon:yes gene_type:complete